MSSAKANSHNLGSPPELMTREEAATYLRVSIPLLERDAQERHLSIPMIRIGRRCLYPRRAVEEWLEAQRIGVRKVEERGLL
jgi:excisionase family DNA binding protein